MSRRSIAYIMRISDYQHTPSKQTRTASDSFSIINLNITCPSYNKTNMNHHLIDKTFGKHGHHRIKYKPGPSHLGVHR